MQIIGIDASTKSFGISLFQDNKLIAYDCFTASSTDLIKRIQKIINELDNFLSQYPLVEKIIMEEVLPEKNLTNIKTHKALMYMQAAVIFLIHEKYPKINIEFMYPGTWRSKCGIRLGRGIKREKQKELDIQFVKEKYNINVNDDIADAIGIATSYFIKDEEKIEF